MQKGRPGARLSADNDQIHKNDAPYIYTEGYEAGRRESLGEGTQQRTAVTNGQRSPSQGKKGFTSARHARIKTFQ
jgi:hypothetical protein